MCRQLTFGFLVFWSLLSGLYYPVMNVHQNETDSVLSKTPAAQSTCLSCSHLTMPPFRVPTEDETAREVAFAFSDMQVPSQPWLIGYVLGKQVQAYLLSRLGLLLQSLILGLKFH